jgi:hypothetical protein
MKCVKRYNRVTLDGRPMRVAMKDDHKKDASSTGSLKSNPFGRGGGSPRDRDPTWGAARDHAPSRGPTTFSVTMTGVEPSKKAVPKQEKKKLKAKVNKKTTEKKPAAPAVSGADLDADMDSYFANRPAKE